MAFTKVEELLERYARQSETKEFWEYIMEEDMRDQQITRAQSMAHMRELLQVMRQTVKSYDAAQCSALSLIHI